MRVHKYKLVDTISQLGYPQGGSKARHEASFLYNSCSKNLVATWSLNVTITYTLTICGFTASPLHPTHIRADAYTQCMNPHNTTTGCSVHRLYEALQTNAEVCRLHCYGNDNSCPFCLLCTEATLQLRPVSYSIIALIRTSEFGLQWNPLKPEF